MRKLGTLLLLIILPVIATGQVLDVTILKAKVWVEQNKIDSALSLLVQSGNLPKKAELMGDCYYKKRMYAKASQYYVTADSLNQGEASLGLSRCYAALNKPEKASYWLKNYLGLTHKRSELEIVEDTAFRTFSRSKEWRTLWQNDWYSFSETERNSILALISKGRIQEAQAELEGDEGKFSPRHEYFYLQAKIYEKQHLTDQALVSIEKAITMNSFSDEYYALYANLLKDNKKYNDALESITKAIRINPYSPVYYYSRGEIARLAGNYAMSEKDLKLYQALYPADADTYHQLGLLENTRGNFQNSMDYYDALLARDKTHAQYFLERGSLAITLDQVQKADEDFSLALDLNPNMKDAYLKKGNTLRILNDPSGACFYWSRARDLGSAEAATLIKENCKE